MMHDPKEEEFLNVVRRFSEIGHSRMIQIIAYEWSETQPERARMETPLKTLDAFFSWKKGDPLAHMWKRFKK